MESDINHLIARLGQVDGFGDTGNHLLNIVKSKKPEQVTAKLEEKDSDSKDPKADRTADEDAQKT